MEAAQGATPSAPKGIARFFKKTAAPEIPSPSAAEVSGIPRYFKNSSGSAGPRVSGEESKEKKPARLGGLKPDKKKAKKIDGQGVDGAPEAGARVFKMKKRLQVWKDHAERLGTEAPRGLGGPAPPLRLTKKQKKEQKEKEILEQEQALKRPPAEDAASVAQPKAPRRDHEAMKEASEQAAKEALLAGDASLEAVQRALDLIEVPGNSSRKNVMPKGQTEIKGMLFGLYCYGGTMGVSAATNAHPYLCKLLIASLQAVDSDFPFTGIQLNYNYASRPHVDRNNCGCSYIVGFGDYQGGELWMHDSEAGEEGVSHTLNPDDEDVTGLYQAGSTFLGRVEDIRERWTQFDGNKLHYTQAFSGSRYSVIFFTCDQYAKAPADVRSSLKTCGFDFDWESTEVQANLQQKLADRAVLREQLTKQRAEEALKERMRRGRCIARIWADGWGHQCTAVCAEAEDMCGTHIKGGRWKTHGRFDGDLPTAKRKEMMSTQQKWLKQGLRPPPDEPWTKLVEVPP